ncbi:MAG TPA: hypothetical protein DIC35_02515 [Candidatus Moranbacteria bacterium]|nr:hypothetical protein [Candidatus Moranbacteria bacterium]
MHDKLYKNILATLVYYDVMDYPMTLFEVWKYLIRSVDKNQGFDEDFMEKEDFSLAKVLAYLEKNDKLKKYIDSKNGYYFLKGRNDLVEKRLEKNKISEKKLGIVLEVARVIRFVPYVRMIAIAGRLATKSAEKNSDLDLLIAVKHGKVFTCRLLVTIIVHLLGKRRHNNKIKDRICLNHFITTKFTISARDMFSSHEYCFLKPIFDNDSFMRFHNSNDWIQNYRPNFSHSSDNISIIKDSRLSRLIRRIGEKTLQSDLIENILGNWQKKKIKNNPKSQTIGGLIISSDEELAFWPNFENQGPAVFEKFQNKLRNLENHNQ